MRDGVCEIDNSQPRGFRMRMLVVSIAIAGTMLFLAWIGTATLSPMVGAGILAAVGLVGGLVLRNQARVPGLPLLAAAIMAASLMISAALNGSQVTLGGAVLFMSLLTSTTARNRAGGLVAALILAAAQMLAAII